MRTRGSEEQLDTLKTTPHKSMSNVFKVLLLGPLVPSFSRVLAIIALINIMCRSVRLAGMLARRFLKFGLLHLTNSFLFVLSQALDALGETRWRLNMQVFDVIEQLWEEGGGVANLVDASDVSKPEEL